jgi:hypothetical protein
VATTSWLKEKYGTIFTSAGTGRFAPEPTRSDELRGDGMAPQDADLRNLHDVAVLDDGAVVFTEGPETRHQPGLVRYLPPRSGGLLATALRRDRDRIFAPSEPAFATLSRTAPADATVTVTRQGTTRATLHQRLPAGESRISSAPSRHGRTRFTLTARDAASGLAFDRAGILPRRWLTTRLGRTVAEEWSSPPRTHRSSQAATCSAAGA